MFFTQEDYKKIELYLRLNSMKDTDFLSFEGTIDSKDTITFVHEGKNYKMTLLKLASILVGDSGDIPFANISYKDVDGDSSLQLVQYESLSEAIDSTPAKYRIPGGVIAWMSKENIWYINQFTGQSSDDWEELSLWKDLSNNSKTDIVFTSTVQQAIEGEPQEGFVECRTLDYSKASLMEIYKDNVLISTKKNTSFLETTIEVDSRTVLKTIVKQYGHTYIKEITIPLLLKAWVGVGTSADEVINDDNRINVEENITGTYKLSITSSPKRLYLIFPLSFSLQPVTLDGLEVPMTQSIIEIEDKEYRVLESSNTYIVGKYSFVVDTYLNSFTSMKVHDNLGKKVGIPGELYAPTGDSVVVSTAYVYDYPNDISQEELNDKIEEVAWNALDTADEAINRITRLKKVLNIRDFPQTPGVTTIWIDQNKNDPTSMVLNPGDCGSANPDDMDNVVSWIRKNSHCYTGVYNDDVLIQAMEIRQLYDYDRNYYDNNGEKGEKAVIDGTPDKNGDVHNVWMRLPKFYYKTENEVGEDGHETGVVAISFAKTAVDDSYIEWNSNTLIGVYKAAKIELEGTTEYYLGSFSGASPLVEVSYNEFLGAIEYMHRDVQMNWEGDGYNHYSLVTYQAHTVMALLYYCYYGNITLNCQAILGKGPYNLPIANGGTEIYGMTDTGINGFESDDPEENRIGRVNFWGLEDWWGNVEEWVDDLQTSSDEDVSFINVIKPDTKEIIRQIPNTYQDGLVTQFIFGPYADMIPKKCNNLYSLMGFYEFGFCDYAYVNPYPGYVAGRSGDGYYDYDGVGYLNVYSDPSDAYDWIGSRLLYTGKIIELKPISKT